MSGTSSVTPPSAPAPSPVNQIEQGADEMAAGVEAEVEDWRKHPEGPFAGIVAWAEAEFAKLHARVGSLEGGKTPGATPAPAKPPSPPAASPAPAAAGLSGSGMSTKDSSEAEHKPASTTSGVGTGISGAPATPGSKE